MDQQKGKVLSAPLGKKLRVRIGSCLEDLQTAHVNDDANPHYIDSPFFTGLLIPRIKGFPKQTSTANEAYFDNKKRLFALQISGRFKHVFLQIYPRNILRMI
jgi:Protein of unknown function (DUF1769)